MIDDRWFLKNFRCALILKKNYFLNLEYVKEVIEVINMYVLPIISCIIQQAGYENVQTYQVEVFILI